MYIPATFAQTDPIEIARFVDRHPLATIVGLLDRRIEAHHLPFMRTTELAPGGRLVSHAARANPVWRLGESDSEVLIIFAGAEAYISPSYYASKPEHHQVVPTFNYASVHVRGRLSCSHDPQQKLAVVELLTSRMESGRTVPWSVSDAPSAYIDKMLRGIVALSLQVTAIEAKWKASQNKSPADRRGVVAGLRADAGSAVAIEAATMIEAAGDLTGP